MAEITVKFHGGLDLLARKKGLQAKRREGAKVTLSESMRVRDILHLFEIPERDLYMALIGNKKVSLESELRDGDTLHLCPPLAGG